MSYFPLLSMILKTCICILNLMPKKRSHLWKMLAAECASIARPRLKHTDVFIQGERKVFLASVKVDDMERENEIMCEEIV